MSDTTIINIIEEDPFLVIVNISEAVATGGSDGLTEVIGEFQTGLTTDQLILDHAAFAGKLKLYKNGVRLSTSQYSYLGADVTLADVPEVDDEFIADYKYLA